MWAGPGLFYLSHGGGEATLTCARRSRHTQVVTLSILRSGDIRRQRLTLRTWWPFYNIPTAATDVLTGVARAWSNVKRHLRPAEFSSNHDRRAPKACGISDRRPAAFDDGNLSLGKIYCSSRKFHALPAGRFHPPSFRCLPRLPRTSPFRLLKLFQVDQHFCFSLVYCPQSTFATGKSICRLCVDNSCFHPIPPAPPIVASPLRLVKVSLLFVLR